MGKHWKNISIRQMKIMTKHFALNLKNEAINSVKKEHKSEIQELKKEIMTQWMGRWNVIWYNSRERLKEKIKPSQK